MILLRLIVLGVLLWVVGQFDWRAITAGRPLPIAPFQIGLIMVLAGTVAGLWRIEFLARRLHTLQGTKAEAPSPTYLIIILIATALALAMGLIGHVENGMITFDTALKANLFAIIAGFALGYFGGRKSERAGTKRLAEQVKAWEISAESQERRRREEDRGTAIAQELWGQHQEHERDAAIAEQLPTGATQYRKGSVPEVVPEKSQELLRSPATLDLSPKKSAEREIANSDWYLWSGERVLVNDIAVQIAIHYRDIAGAETDRTVLVRALIGKGHRTGEVTITKFGGRCDLRRADREFEIARVMLASDPETGEKIHIVGSWLIAKAGRSERVRPVETLLSDWEAVRPTSVVVGLDLTRGRCEAFETFTVTIDTVFQPGVAFEGLAVRHKTDKAPGWKGRKRFSVAPDGPIHLAWMAEADEKIADIPVWLASLPAMTQQNLSGH